MQVKLMKCESHERADSCPECSHNKCKVSSCDGVAVKCSLDHKTLVMMVFVEKYLFDVLARFTPHF